MLAFEETGKYVSERHAEAVASGKLTAGKMAAKLNRKFKPAVNIKAKELKPFASEWHHSGFYKGSRGSTMGRTYFFDATTDCEQLYKRICEAREEVAKVAAEPEVERFFFEAGFEKRYDGPRGRKRWQPIAKLTAIYCKPSEGMMNGKNMEISREDFELLKQFNGCNLMAYETFAEFKSRKLEVRNGNEDPKLKIA